MVDARKSSCGNGVLTSSMSSVELSDDLGESGEGDRREAGKDAGNEDLVRLTTTGAFTIEARLAYSSVLLESSK